MVAGEADASSATESEENLQVVPLCDQNFIYRGAWEIASILGVLLDMGEGEAPIRALDISDWPRSGLPWIAFWLKELLIWGTLEPLPLSCWRAVTRPIGQKPRTRLWCTTRSSLRASMK